MKLSLTEEEQVNAQLQKAALLAGLGILIMVFSVPVAEFGIFPKLIKYSDPQETLNNIRESRKLFTLGIFLHLLTLIFDVVVAWALYVFLKPVNKNLALLTAWFRIVFAAISLSALLNLIEVLNLTTSKQYLDLLGETHASLIMLAIRNHGLQWSFGFVFFGIYLVLLGYLVVKAPYVPKIFGFLLMLAGVGYFIDTIKTFFFPTVNLDFIMVTFFGELIFMLWLLIKGWRVKI